MREPTAPSVTERQPAWHGRMRLQEAPAVAPAPPQFWGGGDLDLLHSYIYSPAAVGGGRLTRAFSRPPVGPGAPPLYGGPGHGSDFPYKVGHPDLPRGPVNAVFVHSNPVHSNPLFHPFCSTSLSRSPFFVAPFFVSPAPPLLCAPWPCPHPNTPQYTPVHPSNAPCLTAASPGLSTRHLPGLPRSLPGPLTGTPGLYLDL